MGNRKFVADPIDQPAAKIASTLRQKIKIRHLGVHKTPLLFLLADS
jgi:hypothetical protein